MNRKFVLALCFTSTVLVALNAGFFYTWSFTIMQSLDLIAAEDAIAAMRSINANIRGGWFGVIFFGSAVMLAIAGFFALLAGQIKTAALLFIALVCMVVNIVITSSTHLPLNAALENGAINVWEDYSSEWTQQNHWRMLASLLGLVFSLGALLCSHPKKRRRIRTDQRVSV